MVGVHIGQLYFNDQLQLQFENSFTQKKKHRKNNKEQRVASIPRTEELRKTQHMSLFLGSALFTLHVASDLVSSKVPVKYVSEYIQGTVSLTRDIYPRAQASRVT